MDNILPHNKFFPPTKDRELDPPVCSRCGKFLRPAQPPTDDKGLTRWNDPVHGVVMVGWQLKFYKPIQDKICDCPMPMKKNALKVAQAYLNEKE